MGVITGDSATAYPTTIGTITGQEFNYMLLGAWLRIPRGYRGDSPSQIGIINCTADELDGALSRFRANGKGPQDFGASAHGQEGWLSYLASLFPPVRF